MFVYVAISGIKLELFNRAAYSYFTSDYHPWSHHLLTRSQGFPTYLRIRPGGRVVVPEETACCLFLNVKFRKTLDVFILGSGGFVDNIRMRSLST